NTIKKSNDLSMAKLNQGLNLNQMQLLAFAIFCTQQSSKTEFRKYEFQEKFGLTKYNTKDAYEDSQRISSLQFSTQDLENDRFSFKNVFGSIEYNNGLFTFKWNEDMLPHILELKEKYVMMDLAVTSNFKSSFSWILYEYLKAHFGYWHKDLSKEAILKLFAVEDKKTYQNSTAQFKRTVLDVAIKEINEFTEIKVWYEQIKAGNKIIEFKINWSTGKQVARATNKQIALLRDIYDEIESNLFDYLAMKNSKSRDTARTLILNLKDINNQVNEILTTKQADKLINEAQLIYKQLQHLLNNDRKEKDTSIYFDWLKE